MTLPGGGQPARRYGLPFSVEVFEFKRRTIADAAVQAAYVVPTLQEPEDALPSLFMGGCEVFAREQFRFERAEEIWRCCSDATRA
jgi:hypothetical protein